VNVSFDDWPYPRVAAHRGAGTLAPENTLAAMRLGASFGFRMFEFDVKLSSDGVLVLMHDATLERTTDGTGPVATRTFAELARLDAGGWHSGSYAGEPVPTFERVAHWLLRNGHLANVEIKPCPGREAETGAAAAIEAQRLWSGATVPPILSSFSEVALEAARRAAAGLPRALLFDRLRSDWLQRCLALGCVAMAAEETTLSPAVVAAAHRAGLRVITYTVNDPVRVDELLCWRLDTVITDAVDRIDPRTRSA
jgi:glycerophosphoryl diester phosphodiesterase